MEFAIESLASPVQSEDLRRQYEDLRLHLPDALVEVDIATLRVTFLNHLATVLLGYDEADVEAGLPGLNLLAPEDHPMLISNLDSLAGESLRNRTPYTRSDRSDLFEVRMVRKDGSRFHAEVQGAFILDRDQIPVGIWFLIRNVDQRKINDERLRSAFELNSSILDSVTNAIATITPEGVIELVNRRALELFAGDGTNLAGRNVGDLFVPDSREQLFACISRVLNTSVSVSGTELNAIGLDGATLTMRVSLSPLTHDGRVSALVFAAEDVTDQRRIEEAIQHAQRLESLGILAGGVAHDFNNLLVGILGNVGIARLDPALGTMAREALDEIEETARRAADLARQMLAYAGKARLEAAEIDLVALARDTLRIVRHSVPETISLKRFSSTQPITIVGDATQIRQVVMNLVINAAEAIGHASGEVRVSVNRRLVPSRELRRAVGAASIEPGSYAVLEVADTGPGMDEATRRRIFEPFFTTKFTGRGLGLASVVGIVKSHGGVISVESTPGQGTTFRVYFNTPSNAG